MKKYIKFWGEYVLGELGIALLVTVIYCVFGAMFGRMNWNGSALASILAVMPFLSRGNMGDDLQYPMSLVIIAGMTVGTMVSLFVLPALYWSVYRKKGGRS